MSILKSQPGFIGQFKGSSGHLLHTVTFLVYLSSLTLVILKQIVCMLPFQS